MIEFGQPLMLIAGAGASAIGAWVVWGRGRIAQRVSSVRLWEGLVSTETNKTGRVRWDLLSLVLAAVAACIAGARPNWHAYAPAAPQYTVEWSMRSLAGHETEMFVRMPRAGEERMSVEYFGSEDPDQIADIERLKTSGEAFDGGELRTGVILHPPIDAAQHYFWARLHAGSGIVSTAAFTRETSGGIRVETQGKGDAAIAKVLGLFSKGDGEVMVADEGQVETATMQDNGLVIAMPGSKVSGINEKAIKHLPGRGALEGVNVPGFVRLEGVSLDHYMEANFSPEWKPLGKVNGEVVLAEREFDRHVNVLWVGVHPAETAWANDESFVLFFSDFVARQFSADGNGITEWHVEEKKDPGATEKRWDWTYPAGIAAVVLVGLGMGLSLWREKR